MPGGFYGDLAIAVVGLALIGAVAALLWWLADRKPAAPDVQPAVPHTNAHNGITVLRSRRAHDELETWQ